MPSIHDTVVATLQRLLESSTQPTADMHLREHLQVSSLTMVALVTELCETLGISILGFGEQDLVQLHRVSDVIRLFERRTADAPSV